MFYKDNESMTAPTEIYVSRLPADLQQLPTLHAFSDYPSQHNSSPHSSSRAPSVSSIDDPGKASMLGIEMLMNKPPPPSSEHGGGRSESYNRDEEDVRQFDSYQVKKSHDFHPQQQQPSTEFVPRSVFRTGSGMSDVTEDIRQEVYSVDRGAASPEELLNMKRELLYKFDRLEKKGVRLPRKFTLQSSYEDMKHEYERMRRDKEIDNSVVLQRRILMTAVSGLEFLNARFDPFDLKLDGWSENVHDSLSDYDEIFEELHEKYKGKGNLPPEMKLMMMLGGSAFMFHLTNSMFPSQNLPDAKRIFKENPELARQFASATASTMANEAPDAGTSGMANMFKGFFGGPSPAAQSAPAPPPPPSMRGPGNLNEIFDMAERAADKQTAGPKDDDMESLIEIFSDRDSVASSTDTKMPDNASVLINTSLNKKATSSRGRGRAGNRGGRNVPRNSINLG